MPKPIRIAIAEDHKGLLEAFASAIVMADPNINVVIQATDGEKLIEQMKKTEVDVILLDLRMPNMDGQDALHIIRKKFSQNIKIVIYSTFDDKNTIKKYLAKGANSFITKSTDLSNVLEGIREVHKIGTHCNELVTPELLEEIEKESAKQNVAVRGDHLTESEIVVFKLMCKGLSSEEIAKQLNRSEKTIGNHRYSISKKVGTSNHMLLMEYAIMNGIHKPGV